METEPSEMYHIVGNFGMEFKLTVWWISTKPPN